MAAKIAPDKWRHFYTGILMGAVLQAAGLWLLPGRWVLAIILSLILVIAISYGWELISKITGKGVYEIMDAIASIIGGVLGMGICLLVASLL